VLPSGGGASVGASGAAFPAGLEEESELESFFLESVVVESVPLSDELVLEPHPAVPITTAEAARIAAAVASNLRKPEWLLASKPP
jgi:hypothetical protein